MALVSRMRAPSSRALATPTRLSTAHPRRPAAAAVAAARNISAASAKAPGLADITPDGGAAFSGRQREFRRDLAAAQRQSEQQESQCKSADRATRPLTSRPSPDAPVADGPGAASASASTLSSERSSLFAKTLGSLGSAGTEDARAHDSAAEQRDAPGRRKGGPLASLIYGTHEGRNLDRELERSFSQVLARGKYVHSIVFHEVKPDRVDEYVELVAGWYPRLAQMPEHKVNLVGSWRSEVGECDTFGMLAPSL